MTCSSSARLATSSQKRSTAATASPVSTAAPASRTSGLSVHMVPNQLLVSVSAGAGLTGWMHLFLASPARSDLYRGLVMTIK